MAGKSSKQLRREEKARLKQYREEKANKLPDAPTLLLLGLAGVLILLTCAAYANSFQGRFVYDDTKWIQQMSVDRIQHPIKSILKARRPVVDATLSINYSVADMQPAPRNMTVREIPSPWSYHLVNLIVHLLAGLTLFGLVRRTIRIGPFSAPVKQSAHWFAFCIALLWMLHPLQTQSVTYIIQRAESLMGLFYLLTLYCLLRFSTSKDGAPRIVWLICIFLAAVLGMGSKGVMITVPIVALIYDRIFLARDWQEVFDKRWMAHGLILLSLFVLMMSGVFKGVLKSDSRSATVGFAMSNKKRTDYILPSEYLLTEAHVIPRYLKLSVLPIDQALDYKMDKIDPHKLSTGELFKQSLLPGLLVLALLGATVVALLRKPWLGFVGVWFFVILAPTSTFIPIRDPIYEHRMYLSLAAVIALFVIALIWLVRKFGAESLKGVVGPVCAGVCLLPAAAFGYLTHQRNALYHDPILLWADNVAKVPDNWRARNNLAKQLLDRADEHPEYVDEAISQLKAAVRIDPRFVNGWYNLGNAYSKNAQLKEDAAQRLQADKSLDPQRLDDLETLALSLYDKAADAYRHALEVNPSNTESHIMIGNAFTDKTTLLLARGKTAEAIRELERAAVAFETAAPTARRNTTNDRTLKSRAYYNLGNTYNRLFEIKGAEPSLLSKAREAYQHALEVLPSHLSARVGIGLAFAREGDYKRAHGQDPTSDYNQSLVWFDEGLKHGPPANEEKTALYQCGRSLIKLGKYEQATTYFHALVKRFPGFTPGWYQLADALDRGGKTDDAVEALQRGMQSARRPELLQPLIQSLQAKLRR